MSFEAVEVLIEKVRNYPVLYDTGHSDYKNVLKKSEAWNQIADELGQTCEALKQKWKNLRDCYIKHKKSIAGNTGQAAKKYEKWPWSAHMEFLDDIIAPRQTTSNISSDVSQISDTSSLEGNHVELQEGSNNPSASGPSLIPTTANRKRKVNEPTYDVNKIIAYFDRRNKIKNNLDSVDHLFMSYAKTFKEFPRATQAKLKIEMATLFAEAEMNLAHTQAPDSVVSLPQETDFGSETHILQDQSQSTDFFAGQITQQTSGHNTLVQLRSAYENAFDVLS